MQAFRSEEFDLVPDEQKQAWAMAALIHCDLTRLIVALDAAEGSMARLLWMADLAAKIYEAKRWYLERGGPLLLGIAEQNGYGGDSVREKIRELKAEHQLSGIERLADYRNKLSAHYDEEALEYLERFERAHADEFFSTVGEFVRFSRGWALLARDVLSHVASASHV